MASQYRIDDATIVMAVPTGLVIRTTFSSMSSDGGRCVHQVFVPCSVLQRDEFLKPLKLDK